GHRPEVLAGGRAVVDERVVSERIDRRVAAARADLATRACEKVPDDDGMRAPVGEPRPLRRVIPVRRELRVVELDLVEAGLDRLDGDGDVVVMYLDLTCMCPM